MKIIDAKRFYLYCYNTLSEKDINYVIESNNKSYDYFETLFNCKIDLKNKFYIYETNNEVGIAYGDNEPCNGFAKQPDEIHMVYNDRVKCLGNHEIAHLLSYSYFGKPDSAFIREGFAEYTEENWVNFVNDEYISKSHYDWSKQYFNDKDTFEIEEVIFDSDSFYNEVDKDGCFYTYPVAGAFTKYLIDTYGIKTYFTFYKQASLIMFEKLYSELEKVILDFKNYIISDNYKI